MRRLIAVLGLGVGLSVLGCEDSSQNPHDEGLQVPPQVGLEREGYGHPEQDYAGRGAELTDEPQGQEGVVVDEGLGGGAVDALKDLHKGDWRVPSSEAARGGPPVPGETPPTGAEHIER